MVVGVVRTVRPVSSTRRGSARTAPGGTTTDVTPGATVSDPDVTTRTNFPDVAAE
jgi:hypothetical protein